ncbi:universal stress protein [Fulvivirga lutea]|uniref:Universal stress protein n=1 Tax=Fulvivirga lutea TaxID=2810512 RepID=A0A974ZZ87_9BACT|nr:universal stress protein [Fulvivirga lutea]QSE95844.1 universal stress protein [Fulvivirga lutea]
MKKILVPTDFSELAKNATDLAANLAQKVNAEIILLHVVEDASVASVQYTGELAMPNMQDRLFIYKLIENAKHEFDEVKDKHKGVKIKEEIRVGNPYYSVQDMVGEYNIDLVVMGTKGASGAKELFIGSNAEKVVRHAKCPVLTVHGKADINKLKNIAFATGLKDAQGKHIEIIKTISEFFDVNTHIVRINTPNNFQTDVDSVRELHEYAKESGIQKYDVRIFNDVTEEEGIIHFADEIDADLIVMATHGRKGLAHLVAGSIAEEVVNHSKRPVLTFSMKH